MATSRTGTANWKRARQTALHQARHLTHCPTCGITLDWTRGRQPNSPEADHIIPASRGGQDTPENIQITCRRCNQSRGNKPPKPNNKPPTPTQWVNDANRW